jgi:hypothetical protein
MGIPADAQRGGETKKAESGKLNAFKVILSKHYAIT